MDVRLRPTKCTKQIDILCSHDPLCGDLERILIDARKIKAAVQRIASELKQAYATTDHVHAIV